MVSSAAARAELAAQAQQGPTWAGDLASVPGAAQLAIARALLQVDANLRGPLNAEGLLRRDPRMKERKKSGQPGARKRFQFSKR